MSEFSEWLEDRGLGALAESLSEHGVDFDVLADIEDGDLKELGLNLGDRRRLLRAKNEWLAQADAGQAVEPELPEAGPIPHDGEYLPEESPVDHEAEYVSLPLPAPGATVQEAPMTVGDQSTAAAKPKSRKGRKATAIVITVAVHVGIILLTTLLVIFPPSKDEPEIVALLAPASTTPQQEMKKKNVQKMVKRSTSSATSAAAPMAAMMKSNTTASFTAPDVKRTSTGPLGMGEGDLGNGAFGIGTGLGEGSGDGAMTMFGGSGGAGLKGTFYDFKRDADGKTINNGKDRRLYANIVREFAKGSTWEVPKKYPHYTSPTSLSANVFYFPPMRDTKAGEAFQAKDTGPGLWIAHYTGRVTPTLSGKFSFVGWGDNLLAVKLDKTLVLDASDKHYLKGERSVNAKASLPKQRYGLLQGKSFNLVAGQSVTFDIILGDEGGIFEGGLHILKEGANYKTRHDIPVFTKGTVTAKQQELYKGVLPSKVFENPVFR